MEHQICLLELGYAKIWQFEHAAVWMRANISYLSSSISTRDGVNLTPVTCQALEGSRHSHRVSPHFPTPSPKLEAATRPTLREAAEAWQHVGHLLLPCPPTFMQWKLMCLNICSWLIAVSAAIVFGRICFVFEKVLINVRSECFQY